MNLITRNTDYAIQAIVYVAKSGERLVSTRDLEDDLGLPRPFMRKILQQLQKEGILESIKGNRGGFRLAKPADTIFLLDVMRIFQGELSLADCLLQQDPCPNRLTCIVREKVKKVERVVAEEFAQVTIGTLISG